MILYAGFVFLGLVVADPPMEPDPSLLVIVNYYVPKDMKYRDVREIMDRVSKQGIKRWTLRAIKDAELQRIEIEADPGVPSDLVAKVVKTLLDSGIKKISVERKNVALPKPLLIPDDSPSEPTTEPEADYRALSHSAP